MSTGQSAVKLCRWGEIQVCLIPLVDNRLRCGCQAKLRDPSLTRAIRQRLGDEQPYTHDAYFTLLLLVIFKKANKYREPFISHPDIVADR